MTENKYLADGPLVVAIDSSTTSTKAIVVDAEGNIWHTAKQNIQLHTPAMDQYEHNPIRWWETNRATIEEVLSKLSPTDRSRIAAIGITPAIYKMAWVKEHEPEVFANAYKVMDVHGYVAWMLTGRPVSSQAAADSLGVVDPTRRSVTGHLASRASFSNPTCQNPISRSFICG